MASKPSRTERLAQTGGALVGYSVQKARQKNPFDGPDASLANDNRGNIIGGAITLGLAVIILIMMMLVAGYFVAEAPTDGAYSEQINTTESVSGTAFVIFGVALLAVPTVAVVAYFYNNGLGGFIQGGPRR